MEDAHDVQIGLKYGLNDWSYFAVFDGHAGKRAAAFAAWNLLEFILRDTEFKLDTGHLPEYVCIEPDEEKLNELSAVSRSKKQGPMFDPVTGEEMMESSADDGATKTNEETVRQDRQQEIKSSNQQQQQQPQHPDEPVDHAAVTSSEEKKHAQAATDAQNNQLGPSSKPEFVTLPVFEQLKTVENAIKSGFLRIDQSMRDGACDMSGCTAVCTFISPTHLFIANCGDSRAVLYDGSNPKFVTEDHKPLNPKERKRIIKAGGSATQRINGTLAVSRALGDFEFKKDQQRGPCEQLVSPEPEVTVIQRHPEDEFLILACDGIWDVMENHELCEFVQYKLKLEENLETVCSSVLDVCLHKGSRDNMSIIIVVFENGPKFSEEELARDRKNDEALKIMVRKYGDMHDDFNDFLWRVKQRFSENPISEQDSVYLPPGVGLIAKYDMIHEIFEKEFEEKSDAKTDDE